MITSLFVSIIDANIFHQSHFFLLLTAEGISLYWLLSHFLTLHKEIKILKEEHQYFMDSFQSIRNPITLVHTPLRAACDDSCPEDIKKMLSLVIRNIDCLDEHLTKLMNLRHLLIYSKQMDIAEYELGNFINNRVHSLKNFATDKRIKLEIKTEFNYASVWFDQSKISPIIDKFIKNAIEHSKPEDKRIIFSISSNSEHWELKTFDANKGKLLTCYRRQKYHLINLNINQSSNMHLPKVYSAKN